MARAAASVPGPRSRSQTTWSWLTTKVMIPELPKDAGHAITAKCHATVMTPEIVADNEQWATAWAIGSGYTGDGSGESLYGRPSDELIELSKACR